MHWALGLAPLILAIAVIVELAVTPASQWEGRLFGLHWFACLMLIPLFSIPPLAGLLLRREAGGAPRIPGLPVPWRGLRPAALPLASMYSTARMTVRSFLAAWYTLAIGLVSLVGYLVGSAGLGGRGPVSQLQIATFCRSAERQNEWPFNRIRMRRNWRFSCAKNSQKRAVF